MSLSEKITNMPRYTKVGFFAPLIALSTITIAILLAPGFDWITNALSDLGNYTTFFLSPYKLVSAIVFNSGLIVTGILMMLYAIWFLKWTTDIPTKIGVIPLIISLGFLIGIGVFSENFGYLHYQVSVGFFLTFPFSMWIIGIGWLRFSSLRWFSVLSIILPFISVFMWVDYMGGTSIWQQAVPEIVTALSAIVWLWIINLMRYQRKLSMIGEV
ncbi:MAG: DUF998 domain-containing protein [Candidatus Thorarchaeota archaeon]|nr:MAG: DUF998 domain-containing protein [Candidatus Thorarchaeota archaeon]